MRLIAPGVALFLVGALSGCTVTRFAHVEVLSNTPAFAHIVETGESLGATPNNLVIHTTFPVFAKREKALRIRFRQVGAEDDQIPVVIDRWYESLDEAMNSPDLFTVRGVLRPEKK